MKEYKLTPQQHSRIAEYRNSVSPDVPLPIFVFNITNEHVKLNIKWNTKSDYKQVYVNNTENKENWTATLYYEDSYEYYITFLLLL